MEQPDFTPQIEILGPENWKEYQEFRLKALKTTPTAFGASFEETVLHTADQIRSKLSNPNRKDYVVRVGGKIIAMANYTLEVPANVKHLAKIHGLFVDQDFQRRGIAESLLKRMLDDLHRNPITARVVLSVNNANEAPKALYKKLGFIQFGLGRKEMKISPKHYSDQAQMELIFEDKL